MRVEIDRLALDQPAVDGERLERILLGKPARFLEALARAGGAEALLDLPGTRVVFKVEQKLTALGLEAGAAVAHHDAAPEVFELERA
jgi:hypothetical protein